MSDQAERARECHHGLLGTGRRVERVTICVDCIDALARQRVETFRERAAALCKFMHDNDEDAAAIRTLKL